MVVAGVCLLRVFTVSAAESARGDVEVYEAQDDSRTTEKEIDWEARAENAEIRLSRPGEWQDRVVSDDGEMVPGAERLVDIKNNDKIAVPTQSTENKGRSLASEEPLVVAPAPEVGVEMTHAYQNSMTQEVSVIVSDQGYFPPKISVTQGVPVKMFLSASSGSTLCMMVDEWNIKKGVAPGKVEELTFTPTTPGVYRFYCPVKSIEGSLVVREAPATIATRSIASQREAVAQEVARQQELARPKNEPKNAKELRALIED